MDVNNTPYVLRQGKDDLYSSSDGVAWEDGIGGLTLAQAQALRLPEPTPAAALAARDASAPLVMDRHGQVAIAAGNEVQFNDGSGLRTLRDEFLQPVAAPPSGAITDLAAGGNGLLAAAYSTGNNRHEVIVFHLGRRWQRVVELSAAPLRAAIAADDQVWLLADTSLMLVTGRPLPQPYYPDPTRFEPEEINPQALAETGAIALPAGHHGLAVTVDEDHVYVLAHRGGSDQSILRLRRLEPRGEFDSFEVSAPFLVDLAVVAPGRLAGMTLWDENHIDAPVLRLQGEGSAELVRERYPMRKLAVPRFASSADGRLRYQRGSAAPTPRPTLLKALPKPMYPVAAHAVLDKPLSGAGADTVWHRLYMEACIPDATRIEVAVAVSDTADPVADEEFMEQPPLLRCSRPSELPFHRPGSGRAALYEVLLQRPSGQVRRVTGRYLHIRLSLFGNGSRAPAVHGMRVYYPRFDYQEAYLPRFMRQEVSLADSPEAARGPANGADVRERFLAAFEGMLTPLEGVVAEAEKIWAPGITSPGNLRWLAESVGVRCPDAWPAARKREQVRHSGELQRRRGTLRGVNRALDIATDGAVFRSEVVLVENFRLRRTAATLLGIDMGDEEHPLTLGTGMSGNSIIGDSLVLADEDAREFLALFDPELATALEAEKVRAFFDKYSHQVSVLIHSSAAERRPVIEATLGEEMPAHVQWKIYVTEHPFVLGLAPLLGVDTFLEARPAPRRVRLDDTYIGREGQILNAQAFSPQAVNATGSQP